MRMCSRCSTLMKFQCSSASRKFLNLDRLPCAPWGIQVSVLFSEPKIPQYSGVRTSAVVLYVFQCSSASRKFLNTDQPCAKQPYCRFQCSSASRKFLNMTTWIGWRGAYTFQCSSASRKFINRREIAGSQTTQRCFSALQRAENSSMLGGR